MKIAVPSLAAGTLRNQLLLNKREQFFIAVRFQIWVFSFYVFDGVQPVTVSAVLRRLERFDEQLRMMSRTDLTTLERCCGVVSGDFGSRGH